MVLSRRLKKVPGLGVRGQKCRYDGPLSLRGHQTDDNAL